MCTSWKSFRDQLDAIRAAGVATTRSEVAEGRVGIAAPVFATGQVIDGLSLVVHAQDVDSGPFEQAVIDCAQAVTGSLADEHPWIAR